MSKLGLILIGGAAWAWYNGHLDPYIPREWTKTVLVQPSEAVPSKVTPVSAPVTTDFLTTEEKLLADHDMYVSNFAATHPELAAAIMWQESRGNPRAVSPRGARGLMQVMPATARDLYENFGYTRMLPTLSNLVTEEGSIYFGTAYMEWLNNRRGSNSWEWFIRAYNAGPTGAVKIMSGEPYSASAINENNGYFKAVNQRWQMLKNRTTTTA